VNDIEELKQYVIVHARAQNMEPEHYRAVLDGVRNDEDGTPDSWVTRWRQAGDDLFERGSWLDASRHYALARFPFADGAARAEAQRRSVAAFDRWRRTLPGVERFDVKLPEGTVRTWAAGLADSPAAPRLPVLILMGGIVSLKEQWGAVLAQGARLGLAVIVAELPGVGENTLPYDAEAHRLFPALLDALADRADSSEAYALAMSFSGHLALRAVLRGESRIRGVVTTGAPIREFFTDRGWQAGVPRVTVDTLAHLTGVPSAEVFGHIRAWALTEDELAALEVPVAYGVSTRDEIIPRGDVELLRRHVRRLELLSHDDVHGSPGHVDEVRQWTAGAVLKMRAETARRG
jgi:pimeloyl-ACP methyl ester carboxylesterase